MVSSRKSGYPGGNVDMQTDFTPKKENKVLIGYDATNGIPESAANEMRKLLDEDDSKKGRSVSRSSPTVNNYIGSNQKNDLDRAAELARYNAETQKMEDERKERLELKSKEKKIQKEAEEKKLQNEADKEFEARKKSRWDKYYAKKNAERSRTPQDIIDAGGNSIAEDIIWDELGHHVVKPMKDAAGYAVNTAIDITHPKNQRAVKGAIKGIVGAAQGATKEIAKDMMAYGQAKAIMNGTVDYTEKPVLDKNGKVIGYERVYKPNGNKKDKTIFGKPPIQHRSNKPGPTVRKGTLGKRQGTLENKDVDKSGPTNHRRSGVSLTKTKPGIGAHRRSGVKLVKSSLPTVTNEHEPVNFENDFEGFDKNSFAGFNKNSFAGFGKKNFAGFEKKSFAGFEKKTFEGFEKKPSFHPITHVERPRAQFESSIPPQQGINFSKNRHTTGVKVQKSRSGSGLNFDKNRRPGWGQYQQVFQDIVDEEEL